MTEGIGRRLLQIVEIDLPICARDYGTAPCTAVLGTTGQKKCFKTDATCQSPANYSGTQVLTLRFGKSEAGLPFGMTVFPALRQVSTRAGRINLSGIDPDTNAMGKRATVTIEFRDFTYDDALTDPYRDQRISGAALASGVGYDPEARGTFFARMVARWPYYLGLPLRVLEGYEGDALSAMRTRHYVITEWAGPDADGAVSIAAADVIDLTDDDKTQAPKVSRGQIAADFTAAATSATLKPAGVGDGEYPTSGVMLVGREVIRFTRTGDALTLTERGAWKTQAADHAAGDTAQVCVEYVNQRIEDIAKDLILTYTTIPASLITYADWSNESLRWLGGITFTGLICKPTGIRRLLGELCQLGVMIYPDEVAHQIRFKVNRPVDIGETIYPLTDAGNIVAGTATLERNDDERASEVWMLHGLIDATGSVEDEGNYRAVTIAYDPEKAAKYGQARVKKIATRWFGTTGDPTVAGVLADRLHSRYSDTPWTFSAEVDAKDQDALDWAAVVDVVTRLRQDDDGTPLPMRMQVQSREVTVPGHRMAVEVQTYTIEGRFGFYMLPTDPGYDSATDQQKAEGCFYVDPAIGTLNGDPAYQYF